MEINRAAVTGLVLGGGHCVPSYLNLHYPNTVSVCQKRKLQGGEVTSRTSHRIKEGNISLETASPARFGQARALG